LPAPICRRRFAGDGNDWRCDPARVTADRSHYHAASGPARQGDFFVQQDISRLNQHVEQCRFSADNPITL